MPLGSRIQAIRGLIAAHKSKSVDEKPKTDTLQENQPSGENVMANLTLTNLTPLPSFTTSNVGTIGLTDPAHTCSPYQSLASCQPAYYTAPGAGYVAYANQTGLGGISIQYGQPVTVYHGNQTQTVYPAIYPNQYGAQQYGAANQWPPGTAFTFNPSVDAYVPVVPTSRSEFTEDEIAQAEQIMEELSA